MSVSPNLLFVDQDYQVNRSVRLRGSALGNFTRNLAGASTTTWTLSYWFKTGMYSSTQTVPCMFDQVETTGLGRQIGIRADSGSLSISKYAPSTYTCRKVTTQVFRDPSAWYHVVVVWNTTVATAEDRVQVYVNGSRVTSWSTNTIPAQNTAWVWTYFTNSMLGQQNRDGSAFGFFDGYLAEVNFIDGQALTASSFGVTDSNGIWQPIKYVGTYGTNGFYLNFSSAAAYLPFSHYGNFSGASRLAIAASTAFDLGSAYCIEAWIYPTSLSGTGTICGRWYSGLANEWVLYRNGSTLSGGANSDFSTSGGTIAINTWQHVAMSWDGTTKRLFINGAIVATSTAANSVAGSSALGCYVGSNNDLTSPFTGSISNVRVVKGSAVYTATFTPPTSNLTAITGTQLLTLQSATVIDNSSNAFTITNTSVTITAFTASTSLGADFSGNSNTWTSNNISVTAGITYDSMTDSPTVSAASSNYPVLNPLSGSTQSVWAISDANLTYALGSSTTWASARGNIIIPASGKWYWEVTPANTQNCLMGICIDSVSFQTAPSQSGVIGYNNDGTKSIGGTTTAYAAAWAANDIIGFAYDATAGDLVVYKNNTSLGTLVSGATGNNNYFPCWFGGNNNAQGSVNFGQRPFSYTPPTGFKALNTFNLPAPTIPNGATVMAATTYTGTGATQSIANSSNNAAATSFKPDLVWIKGRNVVSNNVLIDSVRGAFLLVSDLTDAEGSATPYFSSINSNGFTVTGTSAATNQSAETLIGWQWQAGQGTSVLNGEGSIFSTVSVNRTAGFSVVTYTGTGANATIGHGLGVAPKLIIPKSRNNVTNWESYHASLGPTQYVSLNLTNAAATASTPFNNTAPTSSVFAVGTSNGTNFSGYTYVAYCWAEVAGYSKFGSYTGNGSADGTFIHLGFRPRFILTKRTDAISQWFIIDSSRNTYNVADRLLYPNLTNVDTASTSLDILSNGFKLRGTIDPNVSGGTYIYAAFAENPFNISRAR